MESESSTGCAVSPVAAGEVIGGKYVVGRLLASGGMGVVTEGRHRTLDQRVAIKFLIAEPAEQAEAAARFLREAKATAKIESDHVVRVFDVGTHAGVPYLVMELLDGVDLHDHMDASGPLPVAEAVHLIAQALEGLARAHALGIVHRDLKPSNLFLVRPASRGAPERVKVLDFGISKVMPSSLAPNPTLTSSKSLFGSPGYMAPEQVRSAKNVDKRCDIWAIGVIFYELLTGEPAFSGETIGDIFAKIREEPLAPIGSIRQDVPAELAALIMRCLDRDRTKRFADASDLLEALAPFMTARSAASLRAAEPRLSASRVKISQTAATVAVQAREKPATQASWSAFDTARPRTRWAYGGLVVASVAVVVVAVGINRSGSEAPKPITMTDTSSQSPSALESTARSSGSQISVLPGKSAEPLPSSSASAAAQPPVTPSAATAAVVRPGLARRPPPAAEASARGAPSATPPPAVSAKKKDDLGI